MLRREFESLVTSDQTLLEPPCGKANCLIRVLHGSTAPYRDKYMEGAWKGFLLSKMSRRRVG